MFPAITLVIPDFIKMVKRVSIYIDGANFVYGMKSLSPKYSDYHFDFAIYVKSQNSITTVARLSHKDYAQVFTSGIAPFKSLEESGPTEIFIHDYNTRVHHMAFITKNIEKTFQALTDDGMEYLVEFVGSEDEGLKQTFTVASPNTLLVNEYIHRYGDFDGFFTKSNVTLLTKVTEKQYLFLPG